MIVTVQGPLNVIDVRFGLLHFKPESDGTLDLPDYVAKAIVALPGFSSVANLTATATAMVQASAPAETNYLFGAYGQELPEFDQRVADAVALVTARGLPTCSAS